jgi:hypothetical protein
LLPTSKRKIFSLSPKEPIDMHSFNALVAANNPNMKATEVSHIRPIPTFDGHLLFVHLNRSLSYLAHVY